MANPTPTPATPIPATSAAMLTPNFSSAITRVKARTNSCTTRTMSERTGGSNSFRVSQRCTTFPSQRAAIRPQATMIKAPTIWIP
jgi:hypothetical protein